MKLFSSIITCLLFLFTSGDEMTAVHLSQATYCDTTDWDCAVCDDSSKLYKSIEKDGERSLVGYNTNMDSLFVAFRGSANIQNWLDNIQFSQTSPYKNPDIKVEKGFYKIYSRFKKDIIKTLISLKSKYNTERILLTGHSLGAAISTLLAYELKTEYNLFNQIQLITFGSPRVGNSQFVYDFTQNEIKNNRLTHYYDIVPHVPQMLLHYQHVPNEIWYSESNDDHTICDDDASHEDEDCSNSCAPLHCTSVDDHLYYLNVSMGSDGSC